MSASAWLSEPVLYAGLRMARGCLFRHLESVGVKPGSSLLAYGWAERAPKGSGIACYFDGKVLRRVDTGRVVE